MKLPKKIWLLTLLFLTLSIFPLYSPIKNETNQLDEFDNVPIQSAGLSNYTMLVDYPYTWIDASDGLNLTLLDDEYSTQYLPFDFPFYNETFSSVYLSSNGHLSFTGPIPLSFSNVVFPSADPEDRYLIALFWDDLDPTEGGNIYVKNFSTYWVVEWSDIFHYNVELVGSFEVILFQDGSIIFNYDYISYHDGYTCGLNLGLNPSYFSSYQNLNDSVDNFSLFFENLLINTPSLFSGSVSPTIGYNSTTKFKFSVNYQDLLNDPPDYVDITINSTTHSMYKQNSSDDNYMDGCWYEFETIFDEIGIYTYFFNCSDGTFADGDGPYIGPTVKEILIRNYTMFVDYPYTWFNASDGIGLALINDGYSTQDLPFNFTYYNETFSTVYVSANGYLSFTDNTPDDPSEDFIPSLDPDNRYQIAPFWDDLDPSNGGNIYVKNYSTHWVVEWFNISLFNGAYIGNFEVILYNNSEILFSYELINATGTYLCGLNFGFGFDPIVEFYNRYDGIIAPPPFGNFSILFTPYPPQNPSIIINNGDAITNSPLVTLTLSASLALEMRFRNSPTGQWTNWEPYSPTKSIYLAGTTHDTVYSIYVEFQNVGGKTDPVYDSIRYIMPVPSNPSMVINNGDNSTDSPLVTLTLSANGAQEMCFRNGTDGTWTAWESYSTTKQINLAGSTNNTIYSISAKFRNLGGESEVVSDDILFLTEGDGGDGDDGDGDGGRRIPGYPLYLLFTFFTVITAIIIKKKSKELP